MEMEASYYATQVGTENGYKYNGKELNEDFGLNWYAYGARFYDPAIGRFTGVDPIADKFAHVSPYNYAENRPTIAVDLHGLQAVVMITQVGKNSQGQNFVIQSTKVNRPNDNEHNHLYSVYANPKEYGKRGTLEVMENLDDGTSFSKYKISPSDRLLNFFDREETETEVKGGTEFTSSMGGKFGQGKEKRVSNNADLQVGIDEILSAFDVTKSTTSVPIKKGVAGMADFFNSVLQNTNNLAGKQLESAKLARDQDKANKDLKLDTIYTIKSPIGGGTIKITKSSPKNEREEN